MARVAILADIHGNLPALEAVINDLQPLAPDQVIVDGDVINRGPQSKECLALVRAMGWPVVFGNHEEYILKFEDEERPAEWDSPWWLPTRRVWEELDAEELAFLRSMPWFHIVKVPGLPAVRIVHGSPRFLNEGLGFWLSDDEILTAIRDTREPLVVGAHTHRPFDHRVQDRWVLNPGAIGAPFNGNPAAQYLVLTGERGQWQADFRAVSYDRGLVYEAWDRTGYMDHSVIAHVFKFEIETATFHLMAYIRFCEAHDLDLNDMSSFAQYRRAASNVIPGRSLKHRRE